MRLIATDMDGTLLDSERGVPEKNAEAIRYAESRGVTVAVATGRDFTEAVAPLKEAGIRLPLICVNGAETRGKDGGILSQVKMERSLYRKAADILREEDVYYEIYTGKGSFTEDPEKGLQIVVDIMMSTGEFDTYDQVMRVAEARFKEGAVTVTDDYDSILDSGVTLLKLLAFSRDDKKRTAAQERLKKLGRVAVSASASENLEITHIDATKGRALSQFAQSIQVPLTETAAIGDNFNDISMLQAAGTGIAVENAEEEVKAVSRFVTSKNTEGGVAEAIYRLLDS
ncbi:HAD family phosphatase [Alteribacter natronophilus]|nr:HAD family phosphatase [Alteribacter natronophilus]